MISFYDHPTTSDGKHTDCKDCRKEYVKARRARITLDPEKTAEQRQRDKERQMYRYWSNKRNEQFQNKQGDKGFKIAS